MQIIFTSKSAYKKNKIHGTDTVQEYRAGLLRSPNPIFANLIF